MFFIPLCVGELFSNRSLALKASLYSIYSSFIPSVIALLKAITCNHTENLTLSISSDSGPSATMPIINILVHMFSWSTINSPFCKHIWKITRLPPKGDQLLPAMVYCLDLLLWFFWSLLFCSLPCCQGYTALYSLAWKFTCGILLKVLINCVESFTCILICFISLPTHN